MAKAVELGNSGDEKAVTELLLMLEINSAQVRRLAVSALGKLAGFADPARIVPAFQIRLHDNHPQVIQYAIKALSTFGADAENALHDINDILANPHEKEYNHRDAKLAIESINESINIRKN